MPYPIGKRSVTLGDLQVRYLNGGVVTVDATFQLQGPQPPVQLAPPRQRSARHRHVPLRQLEATVRVVRELSVIDLDFDLGNPYQLPDTISGAEFVFHGSKHTWDTIYESGGLRSTGMNTNIDLHVASSAQNLTAYVSGTRSLAVAHKFARMGLDPAQGQYGFVYLFHVEGGIVIAPHLHGHNQAEVTGLGMVPVRDILMFKWLAQPRTVYVNREYNATQLTPQLIDRGLRLIGGGATP